VKAAALNRVPLVQHTYTISQDVIDARYVSRGTELPYVFKDNQFEVQRPHCSLYANSKLLLRTTNANHCHVSARG
jgi:hypothetical protein